MADWDMQKKIPIQVRKLMDIVVSIEKTLRAIYSNIENLVLGARSEMVGSAINQICCWFQVSGFRCQ